MKVFLETESFGLFYGLTALIWDRKGSANFHMLGEDEQTIESSFRARFV